MTFTRSGVSGAYFGILAAILLGGAPAALADVRLPRVRSPIADPFFSRSHVGSRTSSLSLEQNRGASTRVLRANGLCREAHVAEFGVGRGIFDLPANADYCQSPPNRVPGPVRETLLRLKTLHQRVAELFGMSPARLFGFGVHLQLRAHPAGPLMSGTDDRVRLSVFSDYRAEVFPEKIYAHELTHWLLLEGKLGPAANALEPSYLFYESFPDLVASYASDSTVIDFTDPSVRPSLTFPRDGSPIRSMRRPFSEFYLGKLQSEASELCHVFAPPYPRITANERKLCEFYRRERTQIEAEGSPFGEAYTLPPTAEMLASNFGAENCVIRYRDGTAGLDACNVFALGPVLISFFRSIDPYLGNLPLAKFLGAIETAGRSADRLRCRFTATPLAARMEMTDVELEVPDLVMALRTMRQDLNPMGQAAFDLAWDTHGLEEWVKLEKFYRELEVERMGYELLISENPEYATRFGCEGESPANRIGDCRATCTSESAAEEAIGAFGS